jgi:hypothetical protein
MAVDARLSFVSKQRVGAARGRPQRHPREAVVVHDRARQRRDAPGRVVRRGRLPQQMALVVREPVPARRHRLVEAVAIQTRKLALGAVFGALAHINALLLLRDVWEALARVRVRRLVGRLLRARRQRRARAVDAARVPRAVLVAPALFGPRRQRRQDCSRRCRTHG